MLNSLLSGFAIGLSLIVAIGAQNAFVLKQALKQHYILWICVICAGSDSILILLGVAGFAQVIEHYPHVVIVSKYLGTLFLLIYGAKHFYSAYRTEQAISLDADSPSSLQRIVLLCLAFTWLNPHVYLDTVVLMGSISSQYAPYKWWFALGAVISSWLFFFSLCYGAKFLLPWFQNPKAWRVLDILIGMMMWGIALSLVLNI
ncbi:amino acid transporter [Acinetobacter sp. TGL-Y2]|uniref:LysE/ArgO family amino acid transporter n=1 Tax=Acinetobacter sp. TGL-Y2 TaxID=1407071 RepID=UPI0007A66843|nr:LysE/ArgO family amino acid transporter [Acinetobacter sp. TGL-Y2]AMW78438.1 amino acid transporter [Acinetobacter sp. TGL-Y2]